MNDSYSFFVKTLILFMLKNYTFECKNVTKCLGLG